MAVSSGEVRASLSGSAKIRMQRKTSQASPSTSSPTTTSVSRTMVAASTRARIDWVRELDCQIQNRKPHLGGFECGCHAGFVLSDDGRNCKEGGCFFQMHEARVSDRVLGFRAERIPSFRARCRLPATLTGTSIRKAPTAPGTSSRRPVIVFSW